MTCAVHWRSIVDNGISSDQEIQSDSKGMKRDVPDRRRISKLLSLILRHRPDEFGLNMDEFGFIPLEEVVEAVQQRYAAVAAEDIRDLIETSRQHRFEIVDDRIRALYGHSFFVEMDGEPMEPPEHLYLCVPAGQGRCMKEEGIRSEDRFYLHLSPTREVAESRAGAVEAPSIVEVRAAAATEEAGVQFWSRGEVVLTRQEIGAEFVGDMVQIEAPPGNRRDEEEGGRPRRSQGGGRSRDRAPREPRSSRSEPVAKAPVAPEEPKEITFGRRPKFDKGSGRR